MNIYYIIDQAGFAPIYDLVLSKKVRKWDFELGDWKQGRDPPELLDKSYKQELRLKAETEQLYSTIEHGRISISKFSINRLLKTIKGGYETLTIRRGYLVVLLFIYSHKPWYWYLSKDSFEPDIRSFGLYHDLRYPAPKFYTKETLNFSEEVLKQLPKAINR